MTLGSPDEPDSAGREGLPAARFDPMYVGTPPWDIGRPQRAFRELADEGLLRGRVLDVGCGTGEHALLAAALGLEAVGVDGAPRAIAIAERKARERDLPVRFLLADALDLAALGLAFDTILDSGLFHVFDDDERVRYVRSLGAVTLPGARLFILCFSDRQPGDAGPRRIRPEEIRESFATGWEVEAIEPVEMEVTFDPDGIRAWRASLVRTEGAP